MRKIISLIIIAVPTTIPRTNIILPHLFFRLCSSIFFFFCTFAYYLNVKKNPYISLKLNIFMMPIKVISNIKIRALTVRNDCSHFKFKKGT